MSMKSIKFLILSFGYHDVPYGGLEYLICILTVQYCQRSYQKYSKSIFYDYETKSIE
jgi:hypothetical protein